MKPFFPKVFDLKTLPKKGWQKIHWKIYSLSSAPSLLTFGLKKAQGLDF